MALPLRCLERDGKRGGKNVFPACMLPLCFAASLIAHGSWRHNSSCFLCVYALSCVFVLFRFCCFSFRGGEVLGSSESSVHYILSSFSCS